MSVEIYPGLQFCMECERFFLHGQRMSPQPRKTVARGREMVDGMLFSHGYCPECGPQIFAKWDSAFKSPPPGKEKRIRQAEFGASLSLPNGDRD